MENRSTSMVDAVQSIRGELTVVANELERLLRGNKKSSQYVRQSLLQIEVYTRQLKQDVRKFRNNIPTKADADTAKRLGNKQGKGAIKSTDTTIMNPQTRHMIKLGGTKHMALVKQGILPVESLKPPLPPQTHTDAQALELVSKKVFDAANNIKAENLTELQIHEELMANLEEAFITQHQ